MVLGYSRFVRGRSCPNQKLAAVLCCHSDASADLGGVPEEMLYDRMKTVVVGADEDGAVVCNPSLVALANHYGYQPRACHPVLQGTHQSRLDPSPLGALGQAPPRQRAIEIDPVPDRDPSKRPLAF